MLVLPSGVREIKSRDLRKLLPKLFFSHSEIGETMRLISLMKNPVVGTFLTGNIFKYLELPAPPNYAFPRALSLQEAMERHYVHSSAVQREIDAFMRGRKAAVLGVGAIQTAFPTYRRSKTGDYFGKTGNWADTTMNQALTPKKNVSRLVGGIPNSGVDIPAGKRTQSPVRIDPIESMQVIVNGKKNPDTKMAMLDLKPNSELFGGKLEEAVAAFYKAGYKSVSIVGLVHGKSGGIRWHGWDAGNRSLASWEREGLHAITGIAYRDKTGGAYPVFDGEGNRLPVFKTMHIHGILPQQDDAGTSHYNTFSIGEKGGTVLLIGSRRKPVEIANPNDTPFYERNRELREERVLREARR